MTGLLLDQDRLVADFLAQRYSWKTNSYNRAIGLLGKDGELRGGVLFHHWNGANIELSYYGERTMTVGVIRCLAQFMIYTFDPARLTVTTSKRNKRLMRAFQKLGFRLEGIQRCYYGKEDTNRNTGVRFVLFRSALEKLAKIGAERKAQAC